MISKATFHLPPKGLFLPNHEIEDPLPYYYKPLTRYLYRKRIQLGLDLLSTEIFGNVLDFGYGSGLLFPSLARFSGNLYGIDLVSDPILVQSILDKINIKADLKKGDISEAGYPSEYFDLIVCFSVFEHISDPDTILSEMYRILKPGGQLLVGMPRVDKSMEKLFTFIGYKNIEQFHVCTHVDFMQSANKHFMLKMRNRLFGFLPEKLGLYFNMLFEKSVP